MGLQVPAELVPVMDLLGCPWLQVDEDELYSSGCLLMAHGATGTAAYSRAGESMGRVLATNRGHDVAAMRSSLEEAAATRRDGMSASHLLGLALIGLALLVLAWKLHVLAQLVATAATLAMGLRALLVRLPAARKAVRAGLSALLDAIKKGPVALMREARGLLKKPPAPRRDYLAAAAERDIPVDEIVREEWHRRGISWRTDGAPVFHGTRAGPDQVHEQGLLPYTPGDRVYTNRELDEAAVYSRGRYVYEIRAPGGFDRGDGIVTWPGGVHRRYIRGVYRQDTGEFAPNPHYEG